MMLQKNWLKPYRLCVSLIVALCLSTLSASAQNYPQATSTYVNDFADLLDSKTEARVEQILRDAKNERDLEITVVTIGSMSDFGFSGDIADFGTGLFNFWGVGDPKRNDGILILVERWDRQMRIALGAGYPLRFDDRMKRVIDHHFVPWFSQDDYAQGIEAGVLETLKRTKLEFGENGPTVISVIANETSNAFDWTSSSTWVRWVFGIFSGIAGAFGFGRWFRYQPRYCTYCNQKMRLLSEQADNAWLNHGQLAEERLKSKNHDVWYCDTDDSVQIEGWSHWFSGASNCPNCDFRTYFSKRTVLVSATKSSTGSAQVDYDCRHCKHTAREYVTIPKVSSSSSSSSSSGFSGGSSSGGGASGSW
jgi:uncharacterized protein